MAKSSYTKLVQYLQIAFVAALAMQCCVIISASFFALLSTENDCSSPVRVWLIVACVIALSMFLISFFNKAVVVVVVVWTIWNFVWGVIGAVWVFEEDCQKDFEYGFAAAGVVISTSLVMLLGVFVIGCVGGIAACVGYGLMSNYEEIS